MGTQIHAEDNYRRTVELVQEGVIGPVTEVRVWCKVKYGGQKRPAETPAVPKNLHWDLWLGPAPSRPYHPCYVPFSWRNWWDFGTGGLGDFGCHLMDLRLLGVEAAAAHDHRRRRTSGRSGQHLARPDGALRIRRPAASRRR